MPYLLEVGGVTSKTKPYNNDIWDTYIKDKCHSNMRSSLIEILVMQQYLGNNLYFIM